MENPDIVAMFHVDVPGNYMIRIKDVSINYESRGFTYGGTELIPLDDMMREIEEQEQDGSN